MAHLIWTRSTLCRRQLGLFAQSEIFRIPLLGGLGPGQFPEFYVPRLQDVDGLEGLRLQQGRCQKALEFGVILQALI